MLIIGLTGGIGSGKSEASKIFKSLGATILDLDDIAKKITKKNALGYNKIIEYFGNAYLDELLNIDRKKLRAEMFFSEELKNKIEELLHPLIFNECQNLIKKISSPTYVVIVIPLLFENSTYRNIISQSLLIDCSEETQLKRVLSRDGITKELAKKIIYSQMKREEKIMIADNIINNEFSKDILEKNIVYYHKNIIKKLKEPNNDSL